MASPEVTICNMALSNVRDSRFIESRDEGTEQSAVCDVWFDDTRDFVLSKADWGFARKRKALVATGTPPAEWCYSYALPADCLKVRGVEDGVRVRTHEQSLKYSIENSGTGRVILMDVTDAVLIYTMRVTDVGIYPPEFVEALAWKLAANIARPLDKSIEVCRDTLQTAEAMLGRAIAMNYNEQRPDAAPDNEFFTSRLG